MDNEIIRLLNNTYTEECVGDAITDIQLANYNHLYQLQLELINYQKFNFTLGDLKRDNRIQYDPIKNKYYFKIFKEFISPGLKTRFKRSKFYNKLLSMFDIQDNNTFAYNCLVFIDGDLYTGAKIFPTDEFTYIVFEDNMFTTDERPPMTTPVTVIMGPNFHIISQTTNKYRIARGLYSDTPEMYDLTKSSEKYSYIHTITDDNLVSSIVTTKTQDGILTVAANLSDKYNDVNFYTHSIGLQYLLGAINVKGTGYFRIKRQNMPLITETMMVFERSSAGELKYQHDITVKSYYPNIYRLENADPNKTYYMLCFYFDDTTEFDSEKLVYEDNFKLLERVGFDLLTAYKTDDMPDVVRNYKPEKIVYSISDFKESVETNPVDYKDNKLKHLRQTDSKYLYKYFEKQIEYPSRLYLDVTAIDLDTRIRTTTEKETPHQVINFRKPHYVFAFKKSILKDPYNMRIYIDGMVQVFHTLTENDFNIYMYVPCEFVTMFSMMEFESFENEFVEKSFTVKNREAIIDLSSSKVSFGRDDILILDSNKDVIVSRFFTLQIQNTKGDFIDLNEEFNTELGSVIKIKFISDDFNDAKFILRITHPSLTIRQDILTDDDRGKAVYIHKPIDRDVEHFRIYKNGLLIPREHYDIKYRQNADSSLGVDILLNKKVGDVIVVDVSPIKYKEVMKMDLIPMTGFIDTAGILNKPFSLKWYDVYLNGKKLNAGNIDVISPTKFFIYNVETRKNLVIMESNRDEEYFGILEEWRSYNDELWDLYPNLADDLIMMNGYIFDMEEDVLTEPVSKISVDMDRFYEYYAKHEPILNPDEAVIPSEIWNQFGDLQTDDVILINPDINPDAPSILEFINENEF